MAILIYAIIGTSIFLGILILFPFISSMIADDSGPDVISTVDEFGEYYSLGKTWVEFIHSAVLIPPWTSDWLKDHQGESYPFLLGEIDIEEETILIKQFFEKHDITVFDVIKSTKHAQSCEAVGCFWGTYHILVSNEDKTSLISILR